jgi:GntR family transcriptional repressor for pyruvate dehydrogenase complex
MKGKSVGAVAPLAERPRPTANPAVELPRSAVVLRPIDKVDLVEEIIERISAYILDRGLAAGDKLPPERELMTSFRVGRSTIREAIKALRAVGVVEVTARGPVVGGGRPEGLAKSLAWGILISVRAANEAIEARRVLEVALARMAAERATDEEVGEIGRALDAMRSARKRDNYVGADLRFHAAIARGAHNTLLQSVTVTLQELNRSWMQRNTDVEREHQQHAYGEHEAIYEALRVRDAAAAAAAMDAHLEAAGQRLLSSVRPDAAETEA